MWKIYIKYKIGKFVTIKANMYLITMEIEFYKRQIVKGFQKLKILVIVNKFYIMEFFYYFFSL